MKLYTLNSIISHNIRSLGLGFQDKRSDMEEADITEFKVAKQTFPC